MAVALSQKCHDKTWSRRDLIRRSHSDRRRFGKPPPQSVNGKSNQRAVSREPAFLLWDSACQVDIHCRRVAGSNQASGTESSLGGTSQSRFESAQLWLSAYPLLQCHLHNFANFYADSSACLHFYRQHAPAVAMAMKELLKHAHQSCL